MVLGPVGFSMIFGLPPLDLQSETQAGPQLMEPDFPYIISQMT